MKDEEEASQNDTFLFKKCHYYVQEGEVRHEKATT